MILSELFTAYPVQQELPSYLILIDISQYFVFSPDRPEEKCRWILHPVYKPASYQAKACVIDLVAIN